MRLTFFLIFLLAYHPISAQQLSEQRSDSIKSVIQKTYDLIYQNECGQAIKISNDLLKVLEIHPDSSLLERVYRSLSYSYSELKDQNKAFEYGFKSIEINKILKDTLGIILSYNDLGVTYRDFGMHKKAKETFLKAANMATVFENYKARISPFYNIAYELERSENKHKEAEVFLQKSLTSAKKSSINKNERIYVDIYILLGVVNYKLKRYEKAEMFFTKAENIATKQKYFVTLLDYYNEKAQLYKADKRNKEAFLLMNKSITMRDSIEKRKETNLSKKIEAEYNVKESEDNLILIEKEKASQELLYQKAKKYNTILIFLLGFLLLVTYLGILKNRKLKIAKDKAEKLINVKSAFYSEISHELRTPLYAVIELSNLLLKKKLVDSQKQYLESLNFSANHLMALVNNVLELNKVESGEIKVELLNTNLKNLFSNIINSLEYALKQNNNTITLSYDDTIPEQLTGDALKLSQVMINLISNAIKFTKNGHIDIIVKKEEDTGNEVKLYFEISDNGVGISKEKQKKIFEAYNQDVYKSDQVFNGTGLGLSIVHRLLKIMGSQINIESEIGKGSKFYFELLFGYTKDIILLKNNLEAQTAKIKGKHLLVVDDNLVNQLVTKKILENLEITYSIVDSGTKAIEIIKSQKFDCVLMDLHMPEMDGYIASEQIREFNSTIPIIAFTAANSEDVRERIEKSTISACIFKPFYASDLVETICGVLD